MLIAGAPVMDGLTCCMASSTQAIIAPQRSYVLHTYRLVILPCVQPLEMYSIGISSAPHCGSTLLTLHYEPMGTHGLSCRYSRDRHPCRAEINGIIQRSLGSAKIPCHLDPTDLYRSDGKRPSIVPWRVGKVLVWGCYLP